MWMYRANDKGIMCDTEEKTENDKPEDLFKPTHFLKICHLLQLAGSNQTTGSHKSEWVSTQQSINCDYRVRIVHCRISDAVPDCRIVGSDHRSWIGRSDHRITDRDFRSNSDTSSEFFENNSFINFNGENFWWTQMMYLSWIENRDRRSDDPIGRSMIGDPIRQSGFIASEIRQCTILRSVDPPCSETFQSHWHNWSRLSEWCSIRDRDCQHRRTKLPTGERIR